MVNPLQAIKGVLDKRQAGAVDVNATSVIDSVVPDAPPAAEEAGDFMSWLMASGVVEVLLLHTHEIKLMAMFGYALLHGYKLYPKLPANSAFSYRLISLMLACTGGGIMVPIFINSVPVTLSDSYPFVIIASFLIHEYYPMIREIISLQPILKVALIMMYECNRAKVICTLTAAAAKAIKPSEFDDFSLFGPIFCGSIAGCGGAFLPMSKGLDPIKEGGLAQPMFSAMVAATFFHLFNHTSLSDGIDQAPLKAQLAIALYFISYNIYVTYFEGGGHGHGPPKKQPSSTPPTKIPEVEKKPEAEKKPVEKKND